MSVSEWNKNYFDWCWNCFNMGQKINGSDTWEKDFPESAEFSKELIQKLQKADQSKIEYFSNCGKYYKMTIPGINQNTYLGFLMHGFMFLIKEHINQPVELINWEVKNGNFVIYFDLS